MTLKKLASVLCAFVIAASAAAGVFGTGTYAEVVANAEEEVPGEGGEEGGEGDLIGDETVAKNGTCGTSLKWKLGTEGTLVISGTGSMEDYSSKSPWHEDGSNIKKIVIESGVTSIGSMAFEGCSAVKEITLPNTVKSIGNSAFDGCVSLETITIPSSVTSIGGFAFEGTPWLENKLASGGMVTINGIIVNGSNCKGAVNIPGSVKSIASGAFAYCADITSVTIPDSVTEIGGGAFVCSGLTNATIGNGVQTIGDAAFSECGALTTVTIGSGVKSVGEYAFFSTGLKSVEIPQSVKSIGKMAFGYYFKDGGEDEGENVKVSGFKITGFSKTAAEKYANSNGFTFNSIGTATAIVGDADGDGDIGQSDIALLQQYVADWSVTIDIATADVTGDGDVDEKDIALLQQYLADWKVTLG